MVQPQLTELWRDHAVISALARPHYAEHDAQLPFHNWSHAQTVAEQAVAIGQRALANDICIDLDILYPAGAFHDAGFFYKPGTDHTFASKELLSAEIGRSDFMLLGAPPTKANLLHNAIASTQLGVACTTNEARALRQADLDNLTSKNPLAFLDSTWRLYRESKILAGEPLLSLRFSRDAFTKDFIKFCSISYEVLTAYNAEDISLGAHDRDAGGVSLFYKSAKNNIDRLLPSKVQRAINGQLGKPIDYTPIGL